MFVGIGRRLRLVGCFRLFVGAVVIAVVRCLGLTVFGMCLIWIVVVLVMLNMLF